MIEETQSEMTIEVSNSDLDRAYWVARPWVSAATAATLQNSDVLVVPWENFRPDRPALYPEGTSDVVKNLRRELKVDVAIDRDQYAEIALYADAWRLPTLFCQYAAIPLLINLLSNEVDRRFLNSSEKPSVSIELIVEGPSGQCASIKYKGPAEKLPDELLNQAGACFTKESGNTHVSSSKSKSPPSRKGENTGPGRVKG